MSTIWETGIDVQFEVVSGVITGWCFTCFTINDARYDRFEERVFFCGGVGGSVCFEDGADDRGQASHGFGMRFGRGLKL